MLVRVLNTKAETGLAAARQVAVDLRAALAARGAANLIVATGASQFEMLESLVAEPDIDWGNVTAFHLDEYVGLPATHPASFRKYLRERFQARLPKPLRAFHEVNGDAVSPDAECRRLGKLIGRHHIDVACVGIGENGHLAFNDPPADFQTREPYIVVNLDEACRRQQLNEGWFPSFDAVPDLAISMGIQQIMLSGSIVCTVPDKRKAEAARNALEGPVTNQVPASILQKHKACRFFLDTASAALLSGPGAST